jgi:dienelactone hydrolase
MRYAIFFGAVLVMGMAAPTAFAEVVTRTIEYQHAGDTLQGYLAYDDEIEGKRPGVLVVHEWWGLNDYAKRRARMLAELGYVAFCADMYGQGKVTDDPGQAGNWSGHLRGDVDKWRQRALAGLRVLNDQPQTDTEKLAAIGYCFGGSTVLHLAYADAGADIDAVVSFHGSFPLADKNAEVGPAVLVCHGAQDGFAKPKQIQAWQKRMDQVGADWHMTTYAQAEHSFTNPGADAHGVDGVSYNEKADNRSWAHMKVFFERQLSGQTP